MVYSIKVEFEPFVANEVSSIIYNYLIILWVNTDKGIVCNPGKEIKWQTTLNLH